MYNDLKETMNQERKGRFMVHLYTDVPVTGAPNATQKPISMCMCKRKICQHLCRMGP